MEKFRKYMLKYYQEMAIIKQTMPVGYETNGANFLKVILENLKKCEINGIGLSGNDGSRFIAFGYKALNFNEAKKNLGAIMDEVGKSLGIQFVFHPNVQTHTVSNLFSSKKTYVFPIRFKVDQEILDNVFQKASSYADNAKLLDAQNINQVKLKNNML